jgi:hypothetical protein
MHGNETAGVSAPAGLLDSPDRDAASQEAIEPTKARSERKLTHRTYLSRDGWIGLILLLTAVTASISMCVIHRNHPRQQQVSPAVSENPVLPPAPSDVQLARTASGA